ncbi:hypothetical protein BV210_02825 [Halorientalis sp. IM1011]|uniref:DUF7527 domain-containing protein n=1 Tax=Halorientalis sp. IM1011 TaxID=1932360 RepID=UPI00097CD002|nr:hypothetical protein [Halorientalis sp. IM1011]AQL41713.1 hypothetical protein BV210_02825 [Halorientalis sp. IM1011]
MTTRAVEQVDDWDSRPFSGGYRGLHDLADDDFSGIVAAGPTRLCMTSGRVIGILDGTIEDFEDAEGTAYEAPSPALPLLSVMQERSDEVRAQYYTEETSIEEVDRTLTQGNFTGFVELSENVLSGDYYLVYHQGRSMSVAWVGASDNLLIDDEAFDQANDEVGIYEVRPVEIEVIEIPEPAEPATGSTTEAGAAAAASTEAESEADAEPADTGSADEEPTEEEPVTADDEAEPSEPAADESERASGEAEASANGETEAADGVSSESASESAETRDRGGDDATTTETDARAERTRDDDPEQTREEGHASSSSRRESERADSTGTDRQGDRADRSASSRSGDTRTRGQRSSTQEPTTQDTQRDTGARNGGGTGGAAGASGPRSGTGDVARGRQQQNATDVSGLETRSIPSLDPDRTNERDDGSASQGPTPTGPTPAAGSGARSEPDPGSAGNEPARGTGPSSQGTDAAPRQGTPKREPDQAQSDRPPAEGQQGEPRREPADTGPEPEPEGGVDPSEIQELEDELEARETEIADLEDRLETAEEERDELKAERDALEEERDELRERVEQLERRIDELRTEEGGESVADRERLSPAEAIENTNLFVRYRSKGDATLEAAHAGNAEAGAVNDNMQIQYHTQFEAEDVAVNGEPFAAYLTDTIQYNFVEWVVRVLPYEIRDTGHQEALGPLYDALPQIDRAELNGAITVKYQEDGEEHRSQESFDVVLRDRMGNPLLVANMNESRQPASQSMMEGLISASQRVGESKESLAGSFLVTSSFFEPEAMEAASDATGSGLLSRDKRESFVKLSRKDGFHLCLVEAREENFNLSVPEI